MKYILDFDGTLFNTKGLTEAVIEAQLTDIHTTPEVFDQLSPRDFLYEDTIDFLSRCTDQVYILTMMSPVDGPYYKEFQHRKVNDSGIGEYVTEIVYMEGLKGDSVTRLAEGSTVFLDDRYAQLASVAETCPEVRVVQMLRPDLDREVYPGVAIVHNLTEFEDLVKTYE